MGTDLRCFIATPGVSFLYVKIVSLLLLFPFSYEIGFGLWIEWYYLLRGDCI